jgi:hypothetical protein
LSTALNCAGKRAPAATAIRRVGPVFRQWTSYSVSTVASSADDTGDATDHNRLWLLSHCTTPASPRSALTGPPIQPSGFFKDERAARWAPQIAPHTLCRRHLKVLRQFVLHLVDSNNCVGDGGIRVRPCKPDLQCWQADSIDRHWLPIYAPQSRMPKPSASFEGFNLKTLIMHDATLNH